MFWKYLASAILRNKITLSVILLALTVFMGYRGSKIELSYELARVLPVSDSTLQTYNQFKERFGEDGNVMFLGIRDSNLFKLDKFNLWYDLGRQIDSIEGIKDVVSIATIYNIQKDDSLMRFVFNPVVKFRPKTQEDADSIKALITSMPFYDGLIFNQETNATVIAVSFDKKNLDSKNRIALVEKIKSEALAYQEKSGAEVHFSGMPYIRTEFMKIVSHEMELFLLLAVLITSLILFAFFRSFSIVFFSLVVVVIGVIWSLGTVELLGYKISLLSGIIPPLIIIIGVPNCIFLINKYHSEYSIHRNKAKALTRMIEKVGLTLLLANITTAIGFGVFYFTGSVMLVEFGIVAAINVMMTYLITLVLIPAIFTFLPPPTERKIQHLTAPRINALLKVVDFLVHTKRTWVYTIIIILTLVSFYGMSKIKIIGYVVDDLPKEHAIYKDLQFFETNFAGVLPLEFSIDTKSENGIFAENGSTLFKIKALQKALEQYPELSKPISLVEGLKFSYQAYRGGDPKYYVLPGSTELKKLSEYMSTVKGQENKLQSFMDSTRRFTRISYKMADVGSIRMKELVKEIKPKVDSIFSSEKYDVDMTGHSLVFLKNNDYLLSNLFESLLIEIVLITLIGVILFRSVRIIVLSKLPSLIPLLITAGIMGFVGIEFKASTILIFTIAFGITSDGTIYFLTKYRHELKDNNLSTSEAISLTIKETGLSMVYTTLILFCGFGIFAASSFGGTKALGILVSTTLLVSLGTNLILLPSILLTLQKYIARKELTQEPLIEIEEDAL